MQIRFPSKYVWVLIFRIPNRAKLPHTVFEASGVQIAVKVWMKMKYLHVDFDLALERNGRFELNLLAAYSRHKTHSLRPATKQRCLHRCEMLVSKETPQAGYISEN